EPSEIAPSTNIEKDVTKSDSVSAQNVNTPTTNKTLSPFDEGYVPPVLPRRTIVERSNPEMPKPTVANDEANQSEVPTQEETSTEEKPVSLVEEIARKLNIAIPSEEELNEKDANESTDNPNDIIMDLLKQVGFGDKPEEKSLKYEDTIGDL
ncbi:MAG: hypothetical protein J5598_03715, partial [Clostridia bacterium]|nr:hypothetical protein [Clostridia bacterium]